jgi:hypothetical protein
MASKINSMANLLSMFNDMHIKGPVLRSDVFMESVNCHMVQLEFSVANKSELPVMPFGVFGEITNERNLNQAWVKLRIHPSFFNGAVSFNSWTVEVENFNEYIETALITYTVQNNDTVDDGNDVWESKTRALDNVHYLKETVSVVSSISQYDDDDAFDEILGKSFKKKITLSNTYADPQLIAGKYTYYSSLRPGWWLKIEEEMGTVAITKTLHGVQEYNLPPVLGSIRFWEYETKVTDVNPVSAIRFFPMISWSKHAYSGPCKVEIKTTWQPGEFGAVTGLTQMRPNKIDFTCPFFSISTGYCLHTVIDSYIRVGNEDPDWELNSQPFESPATNPTDWPNEIIVDVDTQPYKGGYLRKETKIFPPA